MYFVPEETNVWSASGALQFLYECRLPVQLERIYSDEFVRDSIGPTRKSLLLVTSTSRLI
jgi:hypothetical protein